MRNYYDLLQVQRDASDVVIKASYKALRKRYRPPLFGSRVRGRRITKLLDEAYATLSNPASRAEYDRDLHAMEFRLVSDSSSFDFGDGNGSDGITPAA